ncbi:mitochondrial dynamin GTPase Msp1 [Savitreella phatthalungensis]
MTSLLSRASARIAKFLEQSEISRSDILRIILAASTTYAALVYLLTMMDPQAALRRGDAAKRKQAIKRLQGSNPHAETILRELNEYEQSVASEVVLSSEVNVNFDDIGGLDDIIDDLKESVILPLTYPELFKSSSGLLTAPKGVLLFGPPGCGKTMLAKALASSSGATFINMHISTLTDKWFGESNKLVAALFSLAKKLQPSIIFIDEIDAFLRERARSDHEAMAMIKAEFMSLWDGLASEDSDGTPSRIVVLGATNRPADIDAAILRRMPKRFHVQLPDPKQRLKILQLTLRDESKALDFDWDRVVSLTAGQSGSGIKETCRTAAMRPVREFIRQHGSDTGSSSKTMADSGIGLTSSSSSRPTLDVDRLRRVREQGNLKTRPLTTQDFIDTCAAPIGKASVVQDPLD